jgi:hypothetical protein
MRSLLLILAVLAVPDAAAADPRAEADRLLAEGKALGEAGAPERALEKFRQAERRFPRPVHLCNIGIAYQGMGKLPLALLYLERCRDRARSFPTWLAAKHGEIAAELARTHAPVEIEVEPPAATIRVSALGDDEPLASGERVFLPRGSWQVEVVRSGYRRLHTDVQVSNLAGRRLRLELEPGPGAAPRDSPPEGAGRPVAWLVMGAGVALAGGGAVLHWRSIDARNDAMSLPPGMAFDERRADYRRFGWFAAGAYATGAACVGVGLFMLLRRGDAGTGDGPEVSLQYGGDDAVLSLSFSR